MCERTKGIAAVVLAAVVWLWPSIGAAQGSRAAAPDPQDRLVVELAEGDLVRLSRPARSVFIANPLVADVNVRSPRLVYVFGVRPGKTTLWALDANDEVITNMEIVVEHNLSRLKGAIDQLLPGSGVQLASIDGAIVLSGTVPTAIDAENVRRLATRFLGGGDEIINRLEITESNQVNLRVRIAEVSSEVLNRFGLNWDTLVTTGNFALGFTTLRSFTGATSLLNGNFTNSTTDINGFVDALADDGLITVLAEPNLTALSGETASFLAGGEFPIPVNQEDSDVTIEFREFGVSLAFTPTVLGHNRISLRVQPEVSQLSQNGAVTLGSVQVPALTTRRAQTTVELASGQSFAIAGLYLDNSQELVEKTPGLGDLPIFGALFKSERFERDETELLIVVTPYLVKPVSGELPLPIDNFQTEQQRAARVPQASATAGRRTVPVPAYSADSGRSESTGYLID
jgi:pilus assembly protein CpaC